MILHDLEEYELYKKINFNGTAGVISCSGENGPPNAKWSSDLKRRIPFFICPSDSTPTNIDDGWHGANYAAMISARPDYRYTMDVNHVSYSRPQDIGVMHPYKAAKLRDLIDDGSSNTILMVEIDRAQKLIQQGDTKKVEHPRCGRWFNGRACYADGCRIPEDFGTDTKPKRDESSLDIAVVWDHFVGKKTHGWGRAASSSHGGGAFATMADGSATWIPENVDFKFYQGICTRSGSENVKVVF